MRYIDRRLLFPAVAVTAFAQQQSPEQAAAEAALRARAQAFFDLQVAKKYRQGEAMVAEDSKDPYYNGSKFNIKGFRIEEVRVAASGTEGSVTIVAQVTLIVPAAPPVNLETAKTTAWKLENGEWVYHIDQKDAIRTPFGELKPGNDSDGAQALPDLSKGPKPATLQSLVKADRESVTLTPEMPEQTVTISNELPGPVDLVQNGDRLNGFSMKIEKTHLNAGEKTRVFFSVSSGGEGTQTVTITANPLNTEILLTVNRR